MGHLGGPDVIDFGRLSGYHQESLLSQFGYKFATLDAEMGVGIRNLFVEKEMNLL